MRQSDTRKKTDKAVRGDHFARTRHASRKRMVTSEQATMRKRAESRESPTAAHVKFPTRASARTAAQMRAGNGGCALLLASDVGARGGRARLCPGSTMSDPTIPPRHWVLRLSNFRSATPWKKDGGACCCGAASLDKEPNHDKADNSSATVSDVWVGALRDNQGEYLLNLLKHRCLRTSKMRYSVTQRVSPVSASTA